MLSKTLDLARLAMKQDDSLTAADRNRLLSLLRNHGKEAQEKKALATPEPRLLRRKEAARRLGCSLRTLDSWTQLGILRKVTLPGRVRSVGIPESDLVKLIENGGAPE